MFGRNRSSCQSAAGEPGAYFFAERASLVPPFSRYLLIASRRSVEYDEGAFIPQPERNVILEGIVTTVNEDGSANVSPMGPIVDREITRLVLRPYKTSRTYRNLKRSGKGILHVTDDVELMALAAIGKLDPPPQLLPHETSEGYLLADCCRWFAFEVVTLFDQTDRTTIECKVIDHGRRRDFFGFNRAKHAVVEAAILATRTHLLPAEQISEELTRLATIVDKTAGDQERRAFDTLKRHIEKETAASDQ